MARVRLLQHGLALVAFALGGWVLSLLLSDLAFLAQRDWAPLAGGYWLAYLGLSAYLWYVFSKDPRIKPLIALPVVAPPLAFIGFLFSWTAAGVIVGIAVGLAAVNAAARLRRYRSAEADLAAAHRVARTTGAVLKRKGVLCWTDNQRANPQDIHYVLERVGETVRKLTGVAADFDRPLRILAFSQHRTACRSEQPIWPEDSPLSGLYFTHPQPRMVLSLESASLFPSTVEASICRAAMGWLLASVHTGAHPPIWLASGLAGAAAQRLAESPTFAPGGRARAIRVARAQRGLLEADHLVGFQGATPRPAPKDLWRPDAFALQFRIQQQEWSLMDHLLAHHRDGLETFCKAIHDYITTPPSFKECFGHPAERIVSEWRDAIEAQPPPAHTSPPPEVRSAIENELLAVLTDSSAPLPERRRAVRCWGTAGWVWGCQAVVDLAGSKSHPLAADSHLALQNVSGRTEPPAPPHPSTLSAWRGWADELSSASKGPASPR